MNTATTTPMRLNWLRTRIVDQGLPCVVVSTPQAFKHSVDGFVLKTGFAMEQFIGRRVMKFPLPTKLNKVDLMNVAQVHFPELGDDYLREIANKAAMSENYLQAVEAIATRARYLSRRAGRSTVTLAHVDQAIAEVFPAATQPAGCNLPAAALRGVRTAAAGAGTVDSNIDFRREMRPAAASLKGAGRPDLATRAVRRDAAQLSVADS